MNAVILLIINKIDSDIVSDCSPGLTLCRYVTTPSLLCREGKHGIPIQTLPLFIG